MATLGLTNGDDFIRSVKYIEWQESEGQQSFDETKRWLEAKLAPDRIKRDIPKAYAYLEVLNGSGQVVWDIWCEFRRSYILRAWVNTTAMSFEVDQLGSIETLRITFADEEEHEVYIDVPQGPIYVSVGDSVSFSAEAITVRDTLLREQGEYEQYDFFKKPNDRQQAYDFFYKPNEMRQKLNLPPLKNGESFTVRWDET